MEFEYTVIKTNRRTVGITVKADGTVTVRAPKGATAKEIEGIVEKHADWIKKKLSEKRGRAEEILSEQDVLYLRRLAEKILPDRVAYYSLLTGLEPQRVRISSARSRFGSCSGKGSISLSFYVMLYPERARDLVIVHELCHLRHMDHSKDFYSLLSSFLPDHKERKKQLTESFRMKIDDVREKYGEIF